MQAERPGRVPQARNSKEPLVKHNTPAKAKKTVSAASVFKQSNRTTKQIDVTPQATRRHEKGAEEVASVIKSKLGLRSPQKVEKRVARRRSDIHPLAMANDYRRNLYNTTAQTINKTLSSLLHQLHESTLQTIPSQDNQTSPLKLTAPAKYERMAAKLYQPLSQYRLALYANNRQGERVRFEATLETRMQDYEDHIARRAEEVARLQKQWEMVVGEIWKLGVACLGQDTMEQLLLTKSDTHMADVFMSDAMKAESTLFIPEHGSSSPVCGESRGKKHVTFETPGVHDEATDDLAFLYQPSRYRKDSLPLAPPLPEQDVRALAREIKELGGPHMEEMHKIGKEKQQFWKRKTKQIMQSLVEE
ncbi:hypothetical protein T440DRAFT_453367 [Plenodomus tracheiphilus IPT5]|uniref:Uncharacterized protein n=1 Tax=Plenodomus tracheiphilus IPT5 TaxID=1408161 RepID=A0A6A7B0A2_9PLEO|nr:hypothetical protein T440DRAFT_453367 [Plenodomus tracheiphilus IPT5]